MPGEALVGCPPVTSAALSEADAVKMAATFKALADPVRLRLFSNAASHAGGTGYRVLAAFDDVDLLQDFRASPLCQPWLRGSWPGC